MAFNVFLDANLLLDFTLIREHYPVSKRVIALAVNNDIEAFTTPAIVHIMSYWLTKAYGEKKAKELILSLLQNVRIIDASHDVIINALSSKINDVEDALQYFTAMHHKMDYFLTRDKLFVKQSLPALPLYFPERFLSEVML